MLEAPLTFPALSALFWMKCFQIQELQYIFQQISE